MKTSNLSSKERLSLFADLYEDSRRAYGDELDAFDRHYRQYRGSDEIDGSCERALTVRNITYEMIESQISSEIPPPKVDAAYYSERRDRNAKNIERLLSSLRDKLPYERLNDLDERYTYIYGGSVWYAEWDNTARLGREVGGVRLYCLAPRDFIPQPGISEISDMEYCFIHFTTTKSELVMKYSVSEEELELAECEDGGEFDTGTYSVVTAFYRDDEGEVGRFIFSGDLILMDMPKAYRRKIRICEACGASEADCRCKKRKFKEENQKSERVDLQRILPDGYVIPNKIPLISNGAPLLSGNEPIMRTAEISYYVPRSFPIVVRRNVSLDKSLIGQSDCEYIRPGQQAINKIESRILMKLLRAGITPIVPEDATISVNNSVFGQVIKMKPGESAAQYGKVDTTPDVSQDIAEAERLYLHSKRVLGISDALQGLDTAINESGYSRQLKISQAAGRLESKRKMKNTAYAELDRIIFELYLAFADEPRSLVYKDAYGRIHNAEFRRSDFIELDERCGELYYDDSYLFSVDLNGGAEYQREALWQRNLENLKAGTLGSPESPVTLLRYWQCQERAHYPHARENVEYFTMMLEEREEGAYGSDGEL